MPFFTPDKKKRSIDVYGESEFLLIEDGGVPTKRIVVAFVNTYEKTRKGRGKEQWQFRK